MKTAIYMEDGVLQLVITPETKFEKDAIKVFGDKPMEAKLHSGSFYECQGGWIRQSHSFGVPTSRDDSSLILVARED